MISLNEKLEALYKGVDKRLLETSVFGTPSRSFSIGMGYIFPISGITGFSGVSGGAIMKTVNQFIG